MDSLRRRLLKTTMSDTWATDLALEPEISEVSELHLADTVLLAEVHPHPQSNDVDLKEYYRGVVAAAISQGGNYQGQRISIPWLRMTLAGLEMRPMPPEMMWEEEMEGANSDLPGYDELFPQERLA